MELKDFEVAIPQNGDTWDEFGPMGTTPLNNKINHRFRLDSTCVIDESEALKILVEYNEWRRGAETEMLPPKLIGQAIDVAIECLTKSVQKDED